MQLRTTYPGFVEAVNLYFDKLLSVIKPLMVRPTESVGTLPERAQSGKHSLFCQFEQGGPIIALQVENEYGSFAKDEKYLPFIRDVSSLKSSRHIVK